jgi:SAM-dependent methyltransferase
MKSLVEGAFKGLEVLEIACGTGFWTRFIARTAKMILATDYNIETVQIAQKRDYGKCSVEFALADAFLLTDVRGGFSGGFCGFWWSHVPKHKRHEFLRVFHSHLLSGAEVIMIDNCYVEGNSTPISRQDSSGDSYQLRTLEDGSTFEVLKNFPYKQEIEIDLAEFSQKTQVTFLDYYWVARYRCTCP